MKTTTEKISNLILDTIPEAVAWKDLNSVYMGCNLQFANVAGYKTPIDIIGKTDYDLPWKNYAREYITTDKQVIDSGKPLLNLIEFYHHKNSDDLWLDVSLLPIIDINEETIGTLILFRNITEDMEIKQALHDATTNLEQQVEERTRELTRARQEALEASEANSQFLSSMSHELRTPLNAILGFTQLIQMDHEQVQGTPSEDLNEIFKAGNHLLQLINEVLDLAKIEAGHLSLSLEPVNIQVILKECFDLAAPLARQHTITLTDLLNTKDVHNNVDANTFIHADHLRLKQVLLNLISNAIKYNKKNGSVTVNCQNIEHAILRIIIADTGRGIDVQQQKKLFNAFERLGAEQEEIEGTGIGLVIAKRLIEEMDGHIGFESQPDVGSKFWVELPKVTAVSTPINPALGRPAISNRDSQKTVLYIEDNPANLRMLSKAFENWPNWHLITANESISGVEMAKDHLPDLILLDLNLPVMDGYAVFEQLKQSELTQDIPVFAVSANVMPTDITKGMRAGFTDYMTKPINIETLKHYFNVSTTFFLNKKNAIFFDHY